jgi:outer membrane protein assembly factor BamB
VRRRDALAALAGGLAGTVWAESRKKDAAKAKSPEPQQNWTEWGGPTRNFQVVTRALTKAWPAQGPPKLWTRKLGDGYSAVAVEGNTLFTMYQRGNNDVVCALSAADGSTLWEHTYAAPFVNSYSEGVGPGPYAMPQIFGARLITAGPTGQVHALDKASGKVLWTRKLYDEFGGTRLIYGYASHALAYRDTLILPVGGSGNAVIALTQASGEKVWGAHRFTNGYTTPVLIQVDGQDQVAILMAQQVIGVDPESGELLWQQAHPTQYGITCSMPVAGPGNRLFVASAYNGGGRMLRLRQSGGKTTVEQLWHNPRAQVHFGSMIWSGDHIYASVGQGVGILSAIDANTGDFSWQIRDFVKAQLVLAGEKLIVLDEDGTLGLVSATPQEAKVLAKTPAMTKLAWTPPTVAGNRMYVRDRQTLVAFDVS